MSEAAPLVSILMPTLNGRRYIAAALRSLQDQDYRHLEIIVIDDGSTEDTMAIVTDIAAEDDRIKLISGHGRNIAQARNRGLAEANGSLVTFLDHDDLCPDGKISRQVAYLARHPEAAALYGRTFIFASTETIAARVAYDRPPVLSMYLGAGLFRRSLFDAIGPLDARFKMADDFDLVLRLIEAGHEIAVEDEIAALHRRHPNQATADHDATRREMTLALAASLKRRRAAGQAGSLTHPIMATAQL